MKESVFNYNGIEITFLNGENVMVNATEMAKGFGKRTSIWLNSQQTNDFINELSKVRNLPLADLVQVTKGGNNSGTWMHEDVAIEFARWLSPAFAIWCNDRIKELLKHGFTATEPTIDELIANPDTLIQLATALKQERAAKENAIRESEHKNRIIESQTIEIQSQAPKVRYCNDVLNSNSLIATNIIAMDLGLSAKSLNQRLKERGIIYRSGGMWVLAQKYRERGYGRTKTHSYCNSEGKVLTSEHLYWTEKGRAFILNMFKELIPAN